MNLFSTRTRGQRHGPITRLLSPGDLGQVLKPFVFLDAFSMESDGSPGFGWHPHSGIATTTVTFEGTLWAEESNGTRHLLPAGSVEWMQAGRGVWHRSGPAPETGRIAGFQLWLALTPELELATSTAQYLPPEDLPDVGPIRVVLGSHHDASSPVPSPEGITYLQVALKAGETAVIHPDSLQDVAFLALHSGGVRVEADAFEPETLSGTELAVFSEVPGEIRLTAEAPSWLVYGAARKHPHALVRGRYSVHTSGSALEEGEQEIKRLHATLRIQ